VPRRAQRRRREDFGVDRRGRELREFDGVRPVFEVLPTPLPGVGIPEPEEPTVPRGMIGSTSVLCTGFALGAFGL
jgi:hypothetical protein